MTKKHLYMYRLTDAHGNKTITVVDDLSDNGCIGGIGADGKYHQFDSYELYNAYEWAVSHGMKLDFGTMDVEVPDEIFNKKEN